MVTEKGQAKIMDFGLAKLTWSADLTKTLTVMGTVAYMSPEQARGEAVDRRTDIWSFGAMLYEMLTGRIPFKSGYDQAIIYSILNEAYQPLIPLCPDVPKNIEDVVQKALEKDKTRRYQNMQELIQDLKAPFPFAFPKAEKSIVVLPFENLSPDKDNEYFSDGLTEEVISDLSQVHDLLVISRSSAMTFKGTKKKIREIVQEVNVQFVLEGSVRKAGNNLRITAQLIDAPTDAHIWADKYSGTLNDVFDIQEKVSRAIVAALKMTLSPDEVGKIAERPLANAPAYDCYLRARQEIWRWTEPGLDRALHHLQTALEMVGENALLFAGLGQVYVAYVLGAFRMDEETLLKAEDYTNKALQLDPDLALGYYVLGMVAYMRGDVKHAFRHLQRALSISPDDPDSVLWFVQMVALMRRPSVSRPLVARLLEIDPLTYITHVTSVAHNFYEGRFEVALESARIAFRLDPEGILSRYWYVLALGANKQFEEAWAVLDRWRNETPEHGWVVGATSWFYALQGKKAESLESLSEDALSGAWTDPCGVWPVAEIYALVGETEEALKWLEQGVEMGCINYPFLSRIDPWLENIRGEERFKKLMERVKYEWESFEV